MIHQICGNMDSQEEFYNKQIKELSDQLVHWFTYFDGDPLVLAISHLEAEIAEKQKMLAELNSRKILHG